MYATWRASDTDKCLSEAHVLAVTTLMMLVELGQIGVASGQQLPLRLLRSEGGSMCKDAKCSCEM
eukprot:5925460-Amphidinium_carterae.1